MRFLCILAVMRVLLLLVEELNLSPKCPWIATEIVYGVDQLHSKRTAN